MYLAQIYSLIERENVVFIFLRVCVSSLYIIFPVPSIFFPENVMSSFFFKVKYSSIVYNNIFFIYGCLGWFCFLAVVSKVATNTMS